MNEQTESFMPEVQAALNRYLQRRNKEYIGGASYCIECKEYTETHNTRQLNLNQYICIACDNKKS